MRNRHENKGEKGSRRCGGHEPDEIGHAVSQSSFPAAAAISTFQQMAMGPIHAIQRLADRVQIRPRLMGQERGL